MTHPLPSQAQIHPVAAVAAEPEPEHTPAPAPAAEPGTPPTPCSNIPLRSSTSGTCGGHKHRTVSLAPTAGTRTYTGFASLAVLGCVRAPAAHTCAVVAAVESAPVPDSTRATRARASVRVAPTGCSRLALPPLRSLTLLLKQQQIRRTRDHTRTIHTS